MCSVRILWALSWALFISMSLNAQTNYRSNTASGNWNAAGSWQRYNGSTWVAATEYPGQSAGTGTVTIRNGHTITINVSPANSIGALTIGEGTSGTLTTSNANWTLTVSGNLTMLAGSSFNLRRLALTVNGTASISGDVTDNNDNGSCIFVGLLTVNNNGSISTTNGSPFTFRGGITNDGVLDLTGGNAISFTTNSQSIGGSQPVTMDGVVTVTTITVTNNSADLNLTGTAAGTLAGNGTWRQGTNGVLNYAGSTITVTTVDFNTNLNTVNYAIGTQTVRATTYRSLAISSNGTKTLAGAITVNNDLAISGTATLASDIYQITGNASGTFTMASGSTLTLGRTSNATNILFPTNFTNANIILNNASTVTYQNNSTQTVSSVPTYGNLTVATGGTKTINGNTSVGGNLTVSAGTLSLGTTATTLDVTGTATITGTLSFSGTTTKTVTITGNLSGGGTINMSGGSLLHNLNLGGANNAITTFTTAAVASTVTYTRSGNQQVFGSANYRNLTTSGSGTKSMGGTVTVANTFTIGSGTSFDPVGNSITVNGGSVFAGTLAESNTGGTNAFQDVNLSGGTINGSVTDVTNINGNLSITTGNGTIGRTTLTVSGTTDVASGWTLNLNNNTGVKTFVGEVTVAGSGSWNSTSVTTAGNLIFRGGIDVASASGSFSANVATFNTSNQSITGAGALAFSGAVAITGSIIVTNTNTGGVTFYSTLNGSAGGSTWRNGTNSITYYQPGATTQPMNTGTLDASFSGNSFYYSRAGNQTIKAPSTSYYDLYVSGGSSSTKTLQGNTTVSNNFQIAASTNFDPAGNDFTVSGVCTITGTFADGNAGGTSNLEDVDLSGGAIHSGATGVVNINGNLSMPSSNGTIGRVTLTVTGTTTIATGRSLTFNANSNTGVKTFIGEISINGTGIWTSVNISTASNLDIRGGINVVDAGGSFSAGGATFSTNNQDIAGAGTVIFANPVSISGSIVVTNTTANGVTFNNTIDGTVAGSIFKHGAGAVTYYQPGAVTQPMNTGALDMAAAGNYFYYSRGGAQSIKAPSTSYYYLYLGGSGIKTLQGATTVSGMLSVGAGATIDVSGFDLTVTGQTTLDGALTDTDDAGTNSFSGLLTVNSTGSLTTANNSPFVFEGGITNGGTFIQSGTGAVSFANNQDIDGTAAILLAGPVTIAAGRTLTYKNTHATGITLSGVLDGVNASSTWRSDVNTTVRYQPVVSTAPMNTGILDVSATGCNFYYSATGVQTLNTSTYYNLIISGGGSVTKVLGANTTVNGNLTIAASTTLDVDAGQNYSLTVYGNWINSGTFIARNGTVTFNGSSNQDITTDSDVFYNLIINNSAAGVSLNDNLTVSNTLTLTDGVVTTGANHVIVTSSSPSALTGYTSASFVNGNLRRYIASNTSTYGFPVGNGTGAGNYFLAEIVNNNLGDISYIDSKFQPLSNHNDNDMNVFDAWENGSLAYTSVNTAGVWVLEPDVVPGSGTYSVKLYIENMPGLTDNEFGPLKRPEGMNAAAWSTGGGTLNPNDAPGRTVAGGFMKRSGLTSFSEFGAGQGNGAGVGLPIELLGFDATIQEESVKLEWTTATETNNDFFTVERSQDGQSFEPVTVLEGAGNSSITTHYQTYDRKPFGGTSYYRLKQTDYNGRYTYSPTVSVTFENVETTFHVFPNPVTDRRFYIRLSTQDNSGATGTLEIINTGGMKVYSGTISGDNTDRYPVDLPGSFAPGLYFVVVKLDGKIFRQALVVGNY